MVGIDKHSTIKCGGSKGSCGVFLHELINYFHSLWDFCGVVEKILYF